MTTYTMSEIIRIPNIETYTQEIVNGELILTPKPPKQTYITENELMDTNLSKSVILKCIVNNGEDNISNKSKYLSILVDIWKSMPTQKILQTTIFNMKLTDELGLNGYKWCKSIHMSIQQKNATHTMREILNMLKVNNYSIKISIKLESGKIIYFMN